MSFPSPFVRALALAVGVLLLALGAVVTMTHAGHFHPISSAEVDGALDHWAQTIGIELDD